MTTVEYLTSLVVLINIVLFMVYSVFLIIIENECVVFILSLIGYLISLFSVAFILFINLK